MRNRRYDSLIHDKDAAKTRRIMNAAIVAHSDAHAAAAADGSMDAAITEQAIADAAAHDANANDAAAAYYETHVSVAHYGDADADAAADGLMDAAITEQAIADAAAHDVDDAAAAAFYVTYVADFVANDAAAANTDSDIAAAQDGDVYAHTDAHEAADSADAAAAAADAAELEVIRAEVRHHAVAMVMYFNAFG